MSTSPKPKAYSYLRFSTPEQQKGDSLRRQAALADTYARAHGLEIDAELNMRDLGVSAFRGDNIETGALGAFLQAVRDGVVERGSYLLVESLDRVSRKAARKAVRILEDIVEGGITVVTLNDGKAYTEESLDGFDFLMAVMILIRAHEESATKARRLKAAWLGKRLKIRERAFTAMTPAWLRLDEHRKPVLIEEKAKVVRRIVKDTLRGIGHETIAKALNTEGVPVFGRSTHWHRSYILKILLSPALAGTFVPHINEHREGKLHRIPQEPVLNYFPAVIDTDTWQRLQDVKSAPNARGRHAAAPLRSILSGLARCPDCGGSMVRVNKGKRANVMVVCSRSKIGAENHYRTIPYDPIEAAILRQHEAITAAMPHPDAEVERGLSSAQAGVDELEGRMGELMQLLETRPSDTLARRVAELELILKEARADLTQWSDRASRSERKSIQLRVAALGVAIRSRPMDRARVNAALRELVEAVVIDHHSGHLVFRWRSGGESAVLFMWPKVAA